MEAQQQESEDEHARIAEQEDETCPEWVDFRNWQEASSDPIIVQKVFVDVVGDLVSGILLSQIVYWFLRSKKSGKTETRADIRKWGRLWIAKKRASWWKEIRVTEKQCRRAIKVLENKGFVTTRVAKFGGVPVTHIALNRRSLVQAIKSTLAQEEGVRANGYGPKGQIDSAQRAESSTYKEYLKQSRRTQRETRPAPVVPQQPLSLSTTDETAPETVPSKNTSQPEQDLVSRILARLPQEFEEPHKRAQICALLAKHPAVRQSNFVKILEILHRFGEQEATGSLSWERGLLGLIRRGLDGLEQLDEPRIEEEKQRDEFEAVQRGLVLFRQRVAEFNRTTAAGLPHTIGCPWSTLCGVRTLIYQAIVMSEHPDKVWPRNEDWGAFYPMMLREKWEKASLEVRDVLQQLAKEHNFNIDGFVVDISEGFLGGLLPEGRLAGVV